MIGMTLCSGIGAPEMAAPWVDWRVLDAQYFGLAQRRKRVFVVVDFGNAVDPAEVLLERQGLQGNTPPSRETGEGVAGTLDAGIARRRGSGMNPNQITPAIAGPLTAGMHKGPRGTEAAEGNHIVPVSWPAQIAPTLNAAFGDKQGLEDQHALNGAGLFVPVAFDTTQITSKENGSNPQYGDPCHPLAAGTHPPTVAFKPSHFTRGKDGAPSEVVPPLTADADKGDQDPVVFSIMPQNSGKDYKAREVDVTQPLMAGGPVGGNQGGDFIQRGPTVRRLMPLECARLQGFPDDHCAITYRGKPATDGPQYKAYGNSMAVKNIKWIMDRIRKATK